MNQVIYKLCIIMIIMIKQIAEHEGGHLPFEADITDLVSYGSSPNRILVAVNNTLTPYSLPPGDLVTYNNPSYPKGYTKLETHFDFCKHLSPTSFWAYVGSGTVCSCFLSLMWSLSFADNYAGIDREVFLYTTPKQWIDDITLTYDVPANGDVTVYYSISILTSEKKEVRAGSGHYSWLYW